MNCHKSHWNGRWELKFGYVVGNFLFCKNSNKNHTKFSTVFEIPGVFFIASHHHPYTDTQNFVHFTCPFHRLGPMKMCIYISQEQCPPIPTQSLRALSFFQLFSPFWTENFHISVKIQVNKMWFGGNGYSRCIWDDAREGWLQFFILEIGIWLNIWKIHRNFPKMAVSIAFWLKMEDF